MGLTSRRIWVATAVLFLLAAGLVGVAINNIQDIGPPGFGDAVGQLSIRRVGDSLVITHQGLSMRWAYLETTIGHPSKLLPEDLEANFVLTNPLGHIYPSWEVHVGECHSVEHGSNPGPCGPWFGEGGYDGVVLVDPLVGTYTLEVRMKPGQEEWLEQAVVVGIVYHDGEERPRRSPLRYVDTWNFYPDGRAVFVKDPGAWTSTEVDWLIDAPFWTGVGLFVATPVGAVVAWRRMKRNEKGGGA